jgi:uncharacterized protein (UPF0335 family)
MRTFKAKNKKLKAKIERLEKENAEFKAEITERPAGWKNVKGWRRKGND